ncbi:hypothetical protein E4N94_03320 [Treponema denticola]|uniref:hypothetical protein n=1 Tax=Treponema denticola TaxID=158 RepID=UPI003D8CA59B
MIEKRLKGTNSSYNHSHQKTYKSEAKHLTRSSVPDTIFSNKQQATSNKQQATSGINSRFAQTNSQLNTNFLTVNRTHKSKFPSLCVFYLLKICGHLRCRFAKNSPRRTKSTPAGVFCTLLASAPLIFKSSVSTGMDVGGCPTD